MVLMTIPIGNDIITINIVSFAVVKKRTMLINGFVSKGDDKEES